MDSAVAQLVSGPAPVQVAPVSACRTPPPPSAGACLSQPALFLPSSGLSVLWDLRGAAITVPCSYQFEPLTMPAWLQAAPDDKAQQEAGAPAAGAEAAAAPGEEPEPPAGGDAGAPTTSGGGADSAPFVSAQEELGGGAPEEGPQGSTCHSAPAEEAAPAAAAAEGADEADPQQQQQQQQLHKQVSELCLRDGVQAPLARILPVSFSGTMCLLGLSTSAASWPVA